MFVVTATMFITGILLFIVSASVLCQDCQNCTTTTTAIPQETNVQKSSSNATSSVEVVPPQPPPEPPNNTTKGRALNISSLPPLDDVSMDDEDDVLNMTGVNSTCTVGEPINKGCDEVCTCVAGNAVCTSRICPAPTHKKGTKLDSLCQEKPSSDPCCVLHVCPNTQDTAMDQSKGCVYKNESYQQGEIFNDACEAVCSCEEAGHVSCKPRCPAMANTTSDRCVAVPDRSDSCCKVVLCDVTLDDHEVTKGGSEENELGPELKLVSAIPINSTSVKLDLKGRPNGTWNAESSTDGTKWTAVNLHGTTITGLEAGKSYQFRIKSSSATSNTVSTTLPGTKKISTFCEYKGKNYSRGEEFHDGCTSYCACGKTGVECATIECPTDFGLDVLDPHCLAWETEPPNFVPVPPKCCPETVRCKDNGSCLYAGERFPNWADIPTKLTGCEQRCYCEMGNVTCHAACPPVPATPPSDLPCTPREAILSHPPGDDCCLYWLCPSHSGDHMDMKQNETYETNSTTETPDLLLPFIGPLNPERTQTHSLKTKTNESHEDTKKDFFPGPFSPQLLEEESHKNKQKPDNSKQNTHKDSILDHILAPFHLDSMVNDENMNETVITSMPERMSDTYHHSGYENEMPLSSQDVLHHSSNVSPKSTKKQSKGEMNGKLPIKSISDPISHEKNEQFLGPFTPDLLNHQHSSGINNSNNTQIEVQQDKHVGHSVDKDVYPHENGDQFKPNINQNNMVQFLPYGDNNMKHDQVYFVHNQQFPSQSSQSIKPENDLYQLSHFQIPFHTLNDQKFDLVNKKPQNTDAFHINGLVKQKPEDNTKIIGEMYPHYVNIPAQQNKGQIVPPSLHQDEIYHIIQQNPHQILHRPQHQNAHYLSPEELYLYESDDKFPTSDKTYGHQYDKTVPKPSNNGETILIHSPTIPNSPGLRVEEILAHLQHKGTNTYVNNEHALQSQLHPNTYRESLLTQHSSHPVIPFGHHMVLNGTHQGFGNQDFAGGFPSNPSQNPNEIKVHTLEAVDDTTVRLVFSVPNVLVGLHGRVELRYTSDKQNNEPSTWEQQVLAPPDDLIATPELEFELNGLQPDTTYKIKITVVLRDLQNSPTSDVLTIKTLPHSSSSTSYPPEITVEPELRVAELNSTWVKLEWRTFTEFELQFIDGVQLRYKEPDGKVYAATPLIHRAVTTYTIEGLKPDTQYQIGIFFIPFPGQTTELRAPKNLQITTAIENDPYKFELLLDVHHIKTSSVELSWTGVPYPEDKFVNIFRAIYQSEGGREDFSSFKVAKRDSPANTLITGLKPGTRYRLWLEAYLTNGRIKKSNVKDFTTKAGIVAAAADSVQGKLEATPLVEASDYYAPLVVVSIFAALAIVAVVILLLILARKHGHNKAPITAANSRKVQSAAYDNPSYKTCESDPATSQHNESATATET